MDPAFDSAAFAPAAQHRLAAGALPVRLPPHRDHQPEGRQGEGPPHPHPDRGRGRAPRPARRAGRLPRAPGRRAGGPARRWTRWPRRSGSPSGKPAPVQEGTQVQIGNLVVPDAGVWAFQGAKPGAHQPGDRDRVRLLRVPARQPPGRRACPPLASRSGRPVESRARERARRRSSPASAGGGLPEAARRRRSRWPTRPRR